MKELVDRREIKDRLSKIVRRKIGDSYFVRLSDVLIAMAVPVVDVVEERKEASWALERDNKLYWHACSNCHERLPLTRWGHEWMSPYCPECGAKMRVEDDDK